MEALPLASLIAIVLCLMLISHIAGLVVSGSIVTVRGKAFHPMIKDERWVFFDKQIIRLGGRVPIRLNGYFQVTWKEKSYYVHVPEYGELIFRPIKKQFKAKI